MWRVLTVIASVIALFSMPTLAASRTVTVSPSEVEYINVNGKVIGCTYDQNNKLVVGPSVSDDKIKNSKVIWKSVAKKARKASGEQKIKLKKKSLKLKKRYKEQKAACEEQLESGGSSGGDGGSDGGSGGSREANFDSNGNISEAGRLAFGIPDGVPANVSDGQDIFNTYCSGCHSEQRGRSFSDYRTSIDQAPMFYDSSDIPDDDLADLTAYLNRFNLL